MMNRTSGKTTEIDTKLVNAFFAAVDRGDTAAINDLLKINPNVINAIRPNSYMRYDSHHDKHTHNALCTVISKGELNMVRFLLEKGANFRATYHFSRIEKKITPIEYAAHSGKWDCVLAFCESINPAAQNDLGHFSAVFPAAWHNGKMDVVRTLLRIGAPLRTEARDFELAVHNNDALMLNLLLSRCSERNIYSSAQILAINQNETACIDAFRLSAAQRNFFNAVAILDDIEIVKNLLQSPNSSIDINAKLGGKTALHFSVANGNPRMIELLIDAGANPSIKNFNNRTPYEVALDLIKHDSQKIHWNCIEALAKNDRNMLFNCAHVCRKLDICKNLLDNHTIRPNILNANGWDGMTCLHTTIRHKHFSLFTLLLEKGVDKNIKNTQEQTALQFALSLGADYWDYIVILVGDDYQLLFDCAVICQNLNECKRLLMNESLAINPNGQLRNNDITCLSLVVARKDVEFIQVLKTKNADINGRGQSSPLRSALCAAPADAACIAALLENVSVAAIPNDIWLQFASINNIVTMTFFLACCASAHNQARSTIQQIVKDNLSTTFDFSPYRGEMLYEYLLLNPHESIAKELGRFHGNKDAVKKYVDALPADERQNAIALSKQKNHALYIFYSEQKNMLWRNKLDDSIATKIYNSASSSSAYFRRNSIVVAHAVTETAYVEKSPSAPPENGKF